MPISKVFDLSKNMEFSLTLNTGRQPSYRETSPGGEALTAEAKPFFCTVFEIASF